MATQTEFALMALPNVTVIGAAWRSVMRMSLNVTEFEWNPLRDWLAQQADALDPVIAVIKRIEQTEVQQ